MSNIPNDNLNGAKRDAYFRCPVCKKLYADKDCTLDPIKGYICPNNCERPYDQPPYESPLQCDD